MADSGSEQDIRATARAWLLRQALDEFSPQDREEFQRWYGASERHALAYKEVEQTWSDSAALQDLRHLVEPQPPVQGHAREGVQWLRALAAGVLVAIAIGLLSWTMQRPEIYQTRVGEMRDITLADGTEMTLGGRTTVAIQLRDDRRDAELREGEIFLSVRPDPERPFYVSVGATQVRVVGTRFDVRRGAAQVEIGVLEGTVEVNRAEPMAWSRSTEPLSTPRVLHEGQQLTASVQGELGEPERIAAVQPGAWRKGRRVYVDAPLREIVADANRYSRQQIELADAALGDLRVSVSFRAENQQQMFDSLQLALPVAVDRPQADRIVLRARVGEAAP